MPATLRYQACDETVCYAPTTADTEWTLPVVAAGAPATDRRTRTCSAAIAFGHGRAAPQAAGRRAAAAAARRAGRRTTARALARSTHFTVARHDGRLLGQPPISCSSSTTPRSGVQQRGMFEGRGPLAILLIVLLGGLALNLTPCVLPMIPINLAIIGAGAQAGSRGRGFLLGGVYGAAMALVYGVLGLVVILTAGTFGTINASPWFNLGIAVLFVVLGLAMFDVLADRFLPLRPSRFNPTAGRGTFVLAFSMGAVAALLAGACVAPVVIQVVLFSSRSLRRRARPSRWRCRSCSASAWRCPWPIAGAGIASLPKPGAWMVRVKQAFGVLILATARVLRLRGVRAVREPVGRSGRGRRRACRQQLREGWHASLGEGLATAEREQKPVLIDMWATWCKNCLDHGRDDARERRRESGAGRLREDQVPGRAARRGAGRSRSCSASMRSGLPTYVILRPKGEATGAVQ